jgi:hypothetical protein
VRAALRPRALLEQHELAALELRRIGEQHHGLERERDVAVDVLVQRVPVAGAVAEDQRRRPGLAGGVAALEEAVERRGVAEVLAEPLRPAVGRLGQRRVQRRAELRDGVRQRAVEVLVLALAEPVARHRDRAAEAAGVVERGELLGLGCAEDRRGLREAASVELFVEGGPVERHAVETPSRPMV